MKALAAGLRLDCSRAKVEAESNNEVIALSQARVVDVLNQDSGSESGKILLDSLFAFDWMWNVRGDKGDKDNFKVLV